MIYLSHSGVLFSSYSRPPTLFQKLTIFKGRLAASSAIDLESKPRRCIIECENAKQTESRNQLAIYAGSMIIGNITKKIFPSIGHLENSPIRLME